MQMKPMTSVPDSWERLFAPALRLLDDVQARAGAAPFWTFGGGTVLMLRYRHRLSRDVDIFVPDPQTLGYVTPRLSDVAESITENYVEAALYVKLVLPAGEIDFVAAPNLTAAPFEEWRLLEHAVKVETATEIVAKKMWHRGDRATARDLFDLALVIREEPEDLRKAAPFLVRHRAAFLEQLETRKEVLQEAFAAIDALDFRPTYAECVAVAREFLDGLPAS
ncbi:MAG TPA: nucleotidyl transferase AbiEii/AbiGii toxin family protein [Burkholderiales bacterium]|jgi:predicted nucleotidyltransferase component of viral defense system